LTEEFADWAPEVQEIIKSIPSSDLFKWGLFHRSDLKTWREGLFVLLGDACHAPLPFMAQGAAMAIEDAACLALCLSRSDSVKSGFEAYEEFRKSRTQKVKSMSARNGRIFHLSGVAAFLRNNFLKVFDLKVDRFLYSYNVFDINERLGNKGSTLL
jgi:salicylate hydroxylase